METKLKEVRVLIIKSIFWLLTLALVGCILIQIPVYLKESLYASEDNKRQISKFDCKSDIDVKKINQSFVNCLKQDKKQLIVVLDDKTIDEKEAALLQKVTQKIGKEYDEYSVVNILNSNDRDFMKQLERFDEKGYTEVINVQYKSAVNLFFDEWIEDSQEYVDL